MVKDAGCKLQAHRDKPQTLTPRPKTSNPESTDWPGTTIFAPLSIFQRPFDLLIFSLPPYLQSVKLKGVGDSGLEIQNVGCRVQGVRCRVQGAGCRV